MKYLILFLALFCSCTSMPQKPTVGEELCAVACKHMGGEYYYMSEAKRKCYCEFQMMESLGGRGAGPSPTGSATGYVQTN